MSLRLTRAAVLLAALSIATPAAAEEWFDAYARGLMALKQRDAERAAAAFARAIRLRPEPGESLITYGTNRLDEYYPYLRLAEAQLLAGDLDRAREALTRSAARGREPGAERARLSGRVEAAQAARAAEKAPPPAPDAVSTPPTSLAAPVPTQTPEAVPVAPAASPTPRVAGSRPRRSVEPAPGAASTPPPTAPIESAPSPTVVGPSPPGPADRQEQRDKAPAAGPSPLGIALGLALGVLGAGAWALRARARAFGRGMPVPQSELDTRAIPRALAGPPAAGELFGSYRLLEPLGKGGMAAVFKAERNGEVRALKRPLAGFLEDPEFLERFLREAEIGRSLHHPNIVRIYERGDADGTPYFTMELVKGQTLQALLREQGAFEPDPSARLVSQVAEALDYAHLKGVVHRDLKPSNIMVLDDGTVKVMDYGIARARRFEGLTIAGTFLGTPEYAAPETARGEPSDARSDLYSLGVVFYELVTGKPPFAGETAFVTLQKQCTEPPAPPSTVAPGVPARLEAIILRLLSKDPAERYPGAEELLVELREYLNRAG